MKKTRVIAVNTTLVLASTLVGVLLSEATLRVAGLFPPDIHQLDQRTGLFTLPKNTSVQYEKECIKNTVVTNDEGFHAFPYGKKNDDEFRIAIVGDSMVEGLAVPHDRHFAALLERMLNAQKGAHPHYVVRPFGISNNGTYANLLYTNAYVFDFSPDLVIDMFYAGNDVTDDQISGMYHASWGNDGQIATQVRPKQENELGEMLMHSAIWRGKRQLAYQRLRDQFDRSHSVATATPEEYAFYDPTQQEMWDDPWEFEGRIFRSFDALVREHHAQFMTVMIPEAFTVHRQFVPRIFPEGLGGLDLSLPETRFLRLMKREQVTAFSLGPELRSAAASSTVLSVWPCDWHWNETGHEWAASGLMRILTEDPRSPLGKIGK